MPRCRAATAWGRCTAASNWRGWTQPKEAAQVRLPEALLKDVREHVARADREITDGYERQAVITFGAGVLGRAGLWAESDALLKANLAKSHSPYYLMSQLGGNARKQGRNDEALDWYAQAFEKSEGPATRLQWGSGYLSARWWTWRRRTPHASRRPPRSCWPKRRATKAPSKAAACVRLQRVGSQAADLERRRQAGCGAAPPAGADRRPVPQGGRRRRPACRLPGAAQAGAEEGGAVGVSAGEDIDQARRRLAALLLGTPLAGALHAAADPKAAPSAPDDAPPGGEFTGRWVHAYAAYGAPKYGPDFTHFDYVEPRAPGGRHDPPAQPRPPQQFRQVQPLDDTRQCAGRRA